MSTAFDGSLLSRVEALTLAVVLVTACITDLRTRRIPNLLVAAGALTGVVLACIDGGAGGIARSLGGMAVGLVVWMPFWLLRMMGGGDVKLFAAGAAWLDPAGALEAAMIAGLCGGVLALVFALHHYGVAHTLFRLSHSLQQPQLLRETSLRRWDRRLPYALAMAAGLAASAYGQGFLL